MSNIKIDLLGKRFDRLVVIAENGRDKAGQVKWLCKCDCGTETTVASNNLRYRAQQSCGCYRKERIGKLSTTHGESSTKSYRKNSDRLKRFRRYRITEEDFQELLEKQNFRCAICGVVPTKTRNRSYDGFHIDHSHVTGRVRGLLCHHCNAGIGMLKESEKILLSSIEYLRKTSQ